MKVAVINISALGDGHIPTTRKGSWAVRDNIEAVRIDELRHKIKLSRAQLNKYRRQIARYQADLKQLEK